jgi:hypothetical protein
MKVLHELLKNDINYPLFSQLKQLKLNATIPNKIEGVPVVYSDG